jgi:hypothetical protein
MTDYFAGYEIIASTKNFLVTSESDPGARQRALYIGGVCDSDLAQLNDLFSTHFEAGTSSPHTIWVNVLQDDPTSPSNGWNYGYETDESSRIVIRRAFTPPPPSPPSLFPPDPPPLTGPNLNNAIIEFPRFVFVAELAEILMDFTGYGWDAGHSPGEGLSNLLGALLHPAGYYDTGQGPRINQWLNGGGGPPPIAPRADFVFNTMNTDQDIFSYGCGILFINYLVYQLGKPLKTVIRAGGSTLAETYARVTGQPASAAYPAFNGLLQAHIGSSTTNNMRRDNIFPLLDVPFRSLDVSEGDPIDAGDETDPLLVSWDVKPGLFCSKEPYEFQRQRTLIEQPIYVRARGMANAQFAWGINGFESSGPQSGPWTTITVATPLTVKNPDGTTTNVAGEVNLQYATAGVWNGFVVYLKTLNWDGNCEITLNFSAREAAIPGETEVAASETVFLTTITWKAGQRLKDARKSCNPFYAAVNTSFWYLTAKLADFKNRPDPPPPEGQVLEIVEAVGRLQRDVARYAKAGHLTEGEVLSQLAIPGVLRSKNPAPAEVDIARLQPRGKSLAPQARQEGGGD